MSSSPAGTKHDPAPVVRTSYLAQSSPADSFIMSATPLQEQQERAMRQVLQEEVRSCLLSPPQLELDPLPFGERCCWSAVKPSRGTMLTPA